jgi:MtN3 and saliva related transmembrane protein
VKAEDAIGWLSTGVLLTTLLQQMWVQWKKATATGVSPWLFTGQCAASIGFLIYSVMTGSIVFVVSNALILATAIVGQGLTLYLKRHPRPVDTGSAMDDLSQPITGKTKSS